MDTHPHTRTLRSLRGRGWCPIDVRTWWQRNSLQSCQAERGVCVVASQGPPPEKTSLPSWPSPAAPVGHLQQWPRAPGARAIRAGPGSLPNARLSSASRRAAPGQGGRPQAQQDGPGKACAWPVSWAARPGKPHCGAGRAVPGRREGQGGARGGRGRAPTARPGPRGPRAPGLRGATARRLPRPGALRRAPPGPGPAALLEPPERPYRDREPHRPAPSACGRRAATSQSAPGRAPGRRGAAAGAASCTTRACARRRRPAQQFPGADPARRRRVGRAAAAGGHRRAPPRSPGQPRSRTTPLGARAPGEARDYPRPAPQEVEARQGPRPPPRRVRGTLQERTAVHFSKRPFLRT